MALTPEQRAAIMQQRRDWIQKYQRNTSLPEVELNQSLLQRPDAQAAMQAGPEAFYAWKQANNVQSPGGQHVDFGTGQIVKDRDVFWTHALPAMTGLATAGMALPALAGGGAAAAAGGGASAATGGGSMGLLGKIGQGALGLLGGGSSGNKWLDLGLGAIKNIGGVAGDAAAGRAEGRGKEADYLLRRDQLAQQGAMGNINADSTRLRQAVLLSLLSGAQDAQVTPPDYIASRMPQMSGGLRPSAIAGRQDIVAAARPRILESLLTGQHLPPMSAAPEAGALDKILSGLGLGGALLGSLGGVRSPGAPAPPGAATAIGNLVNKRPVDIRNSGQGAFNPMDPAYGGAAPPQQAMIDLINRFGGSDRHLLGGT